MLQSAVKRDEVLGEVRLSVERKRAGTAYAKLRQSASGFAIVGVAAQVSLDRRGRIERAQVGVTGRESRAVPRDGAREAPRPVSRPSPPA